MLRAFVIALLALLASFGSAQIQWKAVASGERTRITASIEPGWHLYSVKPVKGEGPVPTSFKRSGAALSAKEITTPIEKFDKNFGIPVLYFAERAEFEVSGKPDGISATYQLCNDRVCLPPKTVEITAGRSEQATAAPTRPTGDVSAQVSAAQKAGFLPFIALAFGFGLLALLTPCVFPMIPITVSYFSKEKERGGKTVPSAIAFCLGIIGTYTVFGVGITLLFGASSVQSFGTSPWVNLALGALFIYLALNLFGVVQLQLPGANRISGERRGGLIAPMLMGFTFTLTSFTCAVGFVGAVLAAAATGQILYPVLGMLAFSAAFALPFFLLALFPTLLQKLPRSGAWMETVKATMGFVELMAAVKFLSNADLVKNVEPILPRGAFLAVWATIGIIGALWLFGAVRLPTVHDGQIGWLRRGFGVAFFAFSLLFLAGVDGRPLGRIESFLPPIAMSATSGGATANTDYEASLRQARLEGKPLLVNFTGVTCTNCRLMERYIFPAPEVKQVLDGMVVSELYTDRQTAGDRSNRALQQKLGGTEALPLYVLVDADGKVVRKFEGSTNDPAEFIRFLKGA